MIKLLVEVSGSAMKIKWEHFVISVFPESAEKLLNGKTAPEIRALFCQGAVLETKRDEAINQEDIPPNSRDYPCTELCDTISPEQKFMQCDLSCLAQTARFEPEHVQSPRVLENK